MKNSSIVVWVFILFVFFTTAFSRQVEVVSVYCKKEVIGGKTFVHREDLVNNEKKEVWSLDGKQVGCCQYEEAILEAEKEVRRKERREQELQRKQAQLFKRESFITLYKKLLRISIERLEQTLKKFDRHNLHNFLAFANNTIVSAEYFNNLKEHVMPEAKKLLYTSDQESDWVKLSQMVAQIEPIVPRVDSFFYDTVRVAINKSDDTKTLKELLELVSAV